MDSEAWADLWKFIGTIAYFLMAGFAFVIMAVLYHVGRKK